MQLSKYVLDLLKKDRNNGYESSSNTIKKERKLHKSKINMNKVEKKPIAPLLKVQQLNETLEFPLSQLSSVRATIQAIKTELQLDFTTKKDNIKRTLSVTRTA